MTETIQYSRTGHVGHLVLNRPERHNALGAEQLEAMRNYLVEMQADAAVRVLLLSGNGDKTFCSGAALDELQGGAIGEDGFQVVTRQIAQLSVPSVCMINGNAFGGGVELALSCDFRIATQDCRMRVPAAEIGLCYPMEGIRRFLESLGPAVTLRVLVAAEEFEGDALLRLGLVDHLVGADELSSFAGGFAERLAGLAPLAVQSMKGILRQAARGDIDLDYVAERTQLCLQSEDLEEGFTAKREKRAPRFTGR